MRSEYRRVDRQVVAHAANGTEVTWTVAAYRPVLKLEQAIALDNRRADEQAAHDFLANLFS